MDRPEPSTQNRSLSWSLSSALAAATVHRRTRTASDLPPEPLRTPLYGHTDSWKACWDQPRENGCVEMYAWRLPASAKRSWAES
jgi:hypothetical protein